MALATILDRTAIQLEAVDPELHKWYEDSMSEFSRMFRANEKVHALSRYLWRLSGEIVPGGAFSKMGRVSGIYPKGTSPKYLALQAGYISTVIAYELDLETIELTENNDLALTNVLSDMIGGAIDKAAQHDELGLFQNGTGILTNESSAPTPAGAGTAQSNMTFAGATDYLRTGRLHVGMAIEVWSSDGATKRTAASTDPTIIENINPTTGVVTFSQNITVNPSGYNDVMAFAGLDSYGPSTLATAQSSWPDNTAAAGLGGDSFRHGIPYVNDITGSNYYLTQLKSTYPQLLSNRVNAANKNIGWAHGRVLQDAIIDRRGVDRINLVGAAHMAQRSAVEDLGISIATVQIPNGPFSSQVDMAAKDRQLNEVFMYANMQHHLCRAQSADRIDYINPENQHRAQLFETRFAPGGDTGRDRLFYVRDATTARRTTAVEFHVEQCYDTFCSDPALQGYIDALKVPGGYKGVALGS